MTDEAVTAQLEDLYDKIVELTKQINKLAVESQNPGIIAVAEHINALIVAVKCDAVLSLGQRAREFIIKMEAQITPPQVVPDTTTTIH
jgi:hypothetical protein